ncbi:MAG: hypothetical protein J6C50_03965 [Rickettsiales bacterium]|nr:hypothetical protein [Rickettsiales bacterium]
MSETKGKIKRRFTPEEDEMLRQLVDEYGTNNWKTIATEMPGRTVRQSKERFTCYLSPEINRTPWTPEEDELLRQKQSEFGNKWTKIAQFFNRRTDYNIKNRYNQLQRQQQKKLLQQPKLELQRLLQLERELQRQQQLVLPTQQPTQQSTNFDFLENLFGADDGFDLAFGQDLFDINLSGADSEFSNLLQGQNSDRGVFGF